MKKLTTLLLAAGMVCAASAPASAVDVKFDGTYDFTFISQSTGFQGDNEANNVQRLRLGMTFTASENLSGYFQMQVGTDEWGTYPNIDGNGDSHGHGISARQVYVDWVIPQTDVKVRMGRSIFGLPKDAFGNNAILDAWQPRDGVVVSAPVTDWLSMTAFWNRADNEWNDGSFDKDKDKVTFPTGKPLSSDVDKAEKSDIFGLVADMKFDGFTVTPYVAYASLDKLNHEETPLANTGDTDGVEANANAYWFGVTSTISYFDPFTLKISGAYGAKDFTGGFTDVDGKEWDTREGWYAQALASYKTSYGTPILGAWYATGDDADEQYARAGWIPTSGGRFLAGTTFNDGSNLDIVNGIASYNIAGTWGVQLGWTNISFLQDLSHDFKVTMFKGTNNSNMVSNGSADYAPYEYMTTGDTAYEISLINTYKIYKNLSASLELAYIINDFDDELYRDASGKKMYDDDDWKVALGFQYKF